MSRILVVEDNPAVPHVVELTAKEFDVLALLASHPGRVYAREQIMRHLWDGDFYGELRAADYRFAEV